MSAVTQDVRVGTRPASLARRRRIKDRAFTYALWACGFLAMLPLLFIVAYREGNRDTRD